MRPPRTEINDSSLVMMGVPKKFCHTTLDDFETFDNYDLEIVKKFVKKYLDNLQSNIKNCRGIFFIGSNGVGKTMLSCIILKEAYRLRYSCRRVTFSQYISYYTESWGTKDKDEKEVINTDFYSAYKGVEFLVLEEVGKEIDSKIAKPILEDLLRYREEHGLITIICCNISMKDFKELYGNSIASLVNGNEVIIRIVAKDRREIK